MQGINENLNEYVLELTSTCNNHTVCQQAGCHTQTKQLYSERLDYHFEWISDCIAYHISSREELNEELEKTT